MATLRASACLRIGKSPEPGGSAAEISQRLGMTPSFAHEVGELYSPRSTNRRKSAIWGFESDLSDDNDIEQHLTHLCSIFEPKRAALMALADDGYDMDWFCFVEVDNDAQGGGILLPRELLRRLAQFPVSLDFDIYPAEPSDDQ